MLAGVVITLGRPELPRQIVVPVGNGEIGMDPAGGVRVSRGQVEAYLATPAPYFSSKRRATSPSSAWRPVSCLE